ncbi:xylulose kinase [Nocardioides sp. zg-ZUI104]|uniref:FGGY family carbohydrate kinase n=1 Tax=Nocardioides faecalis TaxID=2803858 RepID=UPI001BCADE7A|nr:FGGY family carbohydrate kinase [Nocardioides faecalis]MBS4753516.1 xylulose kinase [Nocardioides faecalis]
MLVLGVDSSTQSTKAVLVDADDGTVLASRCAPHPPGTEVDPRAWLDAVDTAADGLLERAAAVAVAGQQHGLVALDSAAEPVRPALLWNDTRSAPQARALVAELGGPAACAAALGSVLVASFTATKLRWLAENEPDNAARVARVLLPHDYVSAHLAAPGTPVFTDRGDASGTGYFDAVAGAWREDLLVAALGHGAELPVVVPSHTAAGATGAGAVLAAGTGDNMAAALGLGLSGDDVLVSIGTSGVASTVAADPVADPTGAVTGFADAAGGYLPLVATINAVEILGLPERLLGVDHEQLADLALSAAPGAGGLVVSPYYGGERTPDLPHATGTWAGLSPATSRADVARAAVEALLCSLAEATDALTAQTGQDPQRVILVGGGSANRAVQVLAPAILDRQVLVAEPGEHVARGAARQAAWALSGRSSPPDWPLPVHLPPGRQPTPDAEQRADGAEVRRRYAALRERLGPAGLAGP